MKLILRQIDWLLLAPIFFLIVISLVILQSINHIYFQNQVISLSIALCMFIIFSQIPYKDYRPYSTLIYGIITLLLIVVFIIGIESRGSIRWIDVAGISLQPSEIGKPLLSLVFADFFTRRKYKTLKTYFLALFFAVPVIFLIYYQPDLGNALLYISVIVLSLIVIGIPLLWIALTGVPFVIALPFLWNILHEYQRQRVLTFLNPLRDPTGSSYNMIQAIIAVGSGMFFGKGLVEGTQSRLRFLPENHTDFIFASLGEKMGFLGSFVVIAAFGFFLYRIYKILMKTPDFFGRVFISCSFLFFLFQFFVNIGMNLGLVPIVGVTLPFVSFGGSSLLASFITVGVLSSISVANNKKNILQLR